MEETPSYETKSKYIRSILCAQVLFHDLGNKGKLILICALFFQTKYSTVHSIFALFALDLIACQMNGT